jgi:uncharacterized protein YndB with AHSA1/START domain
MSTITITRIVNAPVQRAFAGFADAELLATWFWPHLADTTYEIDGRVGGTLRIASTQAAMGIEGEFLAFDEPWLLRFTWTWFDGGVPVAHGGVPVVDTVEVAFVALAEHRTEVTVTHTSVLDLRADGFEQGWNDCMDRLDRLAAFT